MQNVPQIVRERLRATPAVVNHPDAEILTAFGERSLLKPERADVLAHLASCADCREILALALPAIDTGSVVPVSVSVRRSWLTWPAFRWGFATAGVALIALGVVEFEHHRPANSAAVATQLAPSPIATEMKKEVAASPDLEPTQKISERTASLAKKALDKLAGKPRPQLQAAESQPRNPNQAEPSQLMAVAKLQTPKASAFTSQTVEVQAQGASLDAQTADSQIAKASPASGSAEQFLGYNSGPLTRAKPADVEPVQAGAASILATPRWSITAIGGLQRSLDQGKTWQDINVNAPAAPLVAGAPGIGGSVTTTSVKQNAIGAPLAGKVSVTPIFFRAVTAAGNDVWAGGSNAALFHSIDGGNHWTRVFLSPSNAVLTGDILSVEFSDPQHGTVVTSAPEIWITTDGGQTWHKQ